MLLFRIVNGKVGHKIKWKHGGKGGFKLSPYHNRDTNLLFKAMRILKYYYGLYTTSL